LSLPRQIRQKSGENASNDVGRDSSKLLADGAHFGKEGSDNGRRKDGGALNGDIVEQEHEGQHQSLRFKDVVEDTSTFNPIEVLKSGFRRKSAFAQYDVKDLLANKPPKAPPRGAHTT
jgi:hypothetical protein